MNNNKPLASLSLDLDNLWSYMKTHGDAGMGIISFLSGYCSSTGSGLS